MRMLLAAAAVAAIFTATPSDAARHRPAAGGPEFCGDRYCPSGVSVSLEQHRARPGKRPRMVREAPKTKRPLPSTVRRAPSAQPAAAPSLPAILAAYLPPVGAICASAEEMGARAYLVMTATPGGTMSRLGAAFAVARLHPVFAVRAAAAVREARSSGLPRAGLFSSYRPAHMGVGGFADKLNSLHAYGLAGDFTGIGSAGSWEAVKWYRIATANGLHNPYGPRSRAEFNHFQATQVTIVMPGSPLRRTVTARGPLDLSRMWKVGDALIDAPGSRKSQARVRVASAGAEVTLASTFNDRSVACRPGPLDPGRYEVAHPTLPCGTKVRVTHLQTGRSVVAEVADVGPCTSSRCRRERPDIAARRHLDLSPTTAKALRSNGMARVRYEALP